MENPELNLQTFLLFVALVCDMKHNLHSATYIRLLLIYIYFCLVVLWVSQYPNTYN